MTPSATATIMPSMAKNFETLVSLLMFRSARQANQNAYTFLVNGESKTESITYKELDLRARTVASRLQASYEREERALLVYQPGLDYISAFFGCLYAGIAAVPIYPPRPNRSKERLLSIVGDAQPKVMLTTSAIADKLRKENWKDSPLQNISLITTDNLVTSDAVHWDTPLIEGSATALLQYTSGSTATPKGVILSHENLLSNLKLIHEGFGHNPQSSGVIWLPPYHDMGLIGGILAPLYGGFPVTLLPPLLFLQRPVRWLKAISDYRATTSGGPNFSYQLCVEKIKTDSLEGIDLSSWKVAFNGAEPIMHEWMEKFTRKFEPYGFRREAFYPCYGLAEATLIVSGGSRTTYPTVKTWKEAEISKQLNVAHALPDSKYIVSCGKALSNQTIRIVHPDKLTLCSAGEVGEIWLSGQSISQGYWNQPIKTQQNFYSYLPESNEGPFLRTGDLGFLDNEKELFVTGRIKDLIVVRGCNYYPQDIEKVVEESHSCVKSNSIAAFSIAVNGKEKLVIIAEVERRCIKRQSSNCRKKELSVEYPQSKAPCSTDSASTSKEAVNTSYYCTDSCQIKKDIRGNVTSQLNLSPYSILLVKTGSIPKTSSGKIQRYLCRSSFLSDEFIAL